MTPPRLLLLLALALLLSGCPVGGDDDDDDSASDDDDTSDDDDASDDDDTGDDDDTTAPDPIYGSWSLPSALPDPDGCAMGSQPFSFTIDPPSGDGWAFGATLLDAPSPLNCIWDDANEGWDWVCDPYFVTQSAPSAEVSYGYTLGGALPLGSSMETTVVVAVDCVGAGCGSLGWPVAFPCVSVWLGEASRVEGR